ncbi:hypothetical protein KCU73_g15152, partial [Aureobasidium melanogenum]
MNAPVLKIRTASRITWTTSILMNNETPNMSSPAKSTTMNDIIRALDETRERIASMGYGPGKCKYGPGKCTYDPYPLPPKRKRDVISKLP